MNYGIVNQTIAGLYSLSELRVGNFSFAQFSEYSFFNIGALNTIKIIIGFLTIIILIAFIVLFVKLHQLTLGRPNMAKNIFPPRAASSGYDARWGEILRHIVSPNEAEWKFAVIEADKLVDDVLKSAGFPGETMGERLMNTNDSQVRTLNGLWQAHKIRNRLVHDANYFLRHAEARRAVELYEKTLKELGAIT